jgi:hypothetical protein
MQQHRRNDLCRLGRAIPNLAERKPEAPLWIRTERVTKNRLDLRAARAAHPSPARATLVNAILACLALASSVIKRSAGR